MQHAPREALPALEGRPRPGTRHRLEAQEAGVKYFFLGALSAAAPLAYLSAALGWRGSFIGSGASPRAPSS